MEAAAPKPFGALTLIEGTEGDADLEWVLTFRPRAGAGVSLTDIFGISGVTLIEGAVTPLLSGDGVSLTDMLGTGGVTPIDGAFVL